MANKRAKILTKQEFEALLPVVRDSENGHALRDEIALRLSFYAGLRACEIAGIRWDVNVCGPTGKVLDTLHITSNVAKRSVEREIPLDPTLVKLLRELRRRRPEDEYVFYAIHNNTVPMVTKRIGQKVVKVPDPKFVPGRVMPNAVVQWFKRLYAKVDYQGCTSHSGRRTFVTARARLANLKKCSIEDVRILAGHKRLDTTQAYIEPSDRQRDLVSAWE